MEKEAGQVNLPRAGAEETAWRASFSAYSQDRRVAMTTVEKPPCPSLWRSLGAQIPFICSQSFLLNISRSKSNHMATPNVKGGRKTHVLGRQDTPSLVNSTAGITWRNKFRLCLGHCYFGLGGGQTYVLTKWVRKWEPGTVGEVQDLLGKVVVPGVKRGTLECKMKLRFLMNFFFVCEIFNYSDTYHLLATVLCLALYKHIKMNPVQPHVVDINSTVLQERNWVW